MSTKTKVKKQLPPGKVSLGNKLAFACGDIFGGGSFNIINFLFTPFLTLVVGIPMINLTWILLLTKIWDGLIDPFIGKVTDAKRPGKFGKRRFFMLIFAPLVLFGFILLFFPWNILNVSVAWRCVFVVVVYMLYATAQSFVLIPYYSHASEMTDDFNERNRVNAVRLGFSIMSSLVCVAVPGMIASPQKGATSYILMASVFGVIFMVSVIVAAVFSREQVISPPVKSKFSFKEFFRPLKMATYRRHLGMQMCASFGMAVMSSFFFTLCDFVLRRNSYLTVSTSLDTALGRFPIGTVAAAAMFLAQVIALPIYLTIIRKKSKRFAYITGAIVWIQVAALMIFLPAEGAVEIVDGSVRTVGGASNAMLIAFGLLLGLGIGGTVFVPHSAFGDVCDVGELYFGERTEGNFSGLNNFLNTTAQAVGLAIPPAIIGLAGYRETDYIALEEFAKHLGDYGLAQDTVLADGSAGLFVQNSLQWKYTVGNNVVQLMPLQQPAAAQTAIKLTFILLPIVIIGLGIFICSRYKLTSSLQARIVELNRSADKGSPEWQEARSDVLEELGENVLKLPRVSLAEEPLHQENSDAENSQSK